MNHFPPDPQRAGVVVVASRALGGDRRGFSFEGGPPDNPDDAPDLNEVAHESDLVEAMRERGYRLTMVGGGAGGEELRRFYFRKR